MLEEKAGSIPPGSTLRLVDDAGREVLVARRGAAAAGRFRVRRRGDTAYVSFEFFSRRMRSLLNRYVGVVKGVRP
jgi:hypothetical protein